MSSTTFLKEINDLYSSNTYLEKNGTNIIISAVIIIIVFSIITYSEISKNIVTLKQDWNTIRCEPSIIPIAGFINGEKGKVLEYTVQNFTFCVNTILQDITGFLVNPFAILISGAVSAADSIGGMAKPGGGMNSIMTEVSGFIEKIKDVIGGILADISAKLTNVIKPLMTMSLAMQDIIGRISGTFLVFVNYVSTVKDLVTGWLNIVIKVLYDWMVATFVDLREVILILFIVFIVALVVFIVFLLIGLFVIYSEGVAAGLMAAIFTFPVGAALEGMTLATAIATVIQGSIIFPIMIGLMLAAGIAELIVTGILHLLLKMVYVPMNDLIGLFPSPNDSEMGVLHFPELSNNPNSASWGGGWTAETPYQISSDMNKWAGIGQDNSHVIAEPPDPGSATSKISDFKAYNTEKFTTMKSGGGNLTCFHKNSAITMKNGEKILIKDIKVGDMLDGDNMVTAKFTGLCTGEDLYNINNIIVTANHLMIFNNEVIMAKDHPSSILYKNNYKGKVYCLNTDNKTIKIGENVFLDWDELTPDEKTFIGNKFNSRNLHNDVEAGFSGNAKVKLVNNTRVQIKDIKLGDKLSPTNSVIGIFKIDAQQINKLTKLLENDKIYIAPNNIPVNNDLGMSNEHECNKNIKYLYHLLTSEGKLEIENKEFYDYRMGLENILQNK